MDAVANSTHLHGCYLDCSKRAVYLNTVNTTDRIANVPRSCDVLLCEMDGE